jgi:integrase/recombinase XerD
VFLRHNRNLGEPGSGGERYRLQRQSGWLRVRAYGKQLGINVRPHDFRHALACRMLNKGAQMSQVSSILGHASVAVTSTIYAKYDVKNLRAAYDAFAVEDPTEQQKR